MVKFCCHLGVTPISFLFVRLLSVFVTTWQQKRFFLGGEMYDTLSTLSVRRRRHRSSHGPHLHGFALTIVRASPAVKHGAPPPEASVTLYCYDYGCGDWAVVEYWQSCRWSWSQTVHRLFSMCLRRWYDYRLSRYAGAEDFLAHPHYPRRRCELLYFAASLVLTKLCVELPTDSA